MNYTSLLVPVFVEVALTFVLLLATGWMRVRALSARQVKIRDIALGQNAWPARAQQISRAYQNQLELPLLFYVLIAFVLITRVESGVLLALAWIFVAARLIHAAIHVTSNHVPARFYAFIAGMVTLLVMWIVFAARIALA